MDEHGITSQEQDVSKDPEDREYRITTKDEIDLIEILIFFWDRRIVIAKVIAVFFVLGILVTFLSRIEYEASATLMPESSSSQSSASGLLRQYGGMFGISGGAQLKSDAIPTSLYPDIIESVPYQVELMNVPIQFSTLDTTMTSLEYFRDVYPPSTMDYIERYTLGLPGQILSLFKSKKREVRRQQQIVDIERDSVVSLSGVQRGTVGQLKNRIQIVQEEGVIKVTTEFPDPRAAAELGNAAIRLLKEYVREYKTQKAKQELEFVKEQVKEAKKRFEKAQQKLAEFRDGNRNLATARARTQEQELQSQYDLAFDLYNTLSQNLEQAKLKVQENTPVFTTINPIQVPTGNSKPRSKLILGLSVFLGLLAGIIVAVTQKVWPLIQAEISDRG